MYLMRAQVGVHFLLAFVMVATTTATESFQNCEFPPQNKFCFFTSGELVFEERMKTTAMPSAQLSGVGSLESVHAHLLDTNVTEMKELWGAVYFVGNEDREVFEKLAYQRMLLADVRVKVSRRDSDAGQPVTMDCVSWDVGLMPHVLPLSIYSTLPTDLTVEEYLQRLAEIGVPPDYIEWLSTLPKFDQNCPPPPAYIAPAGFAAPALQPAVPPSFSMGHGPQITNYPVPAGKLCIFAAGKMVSEEALKKSLPSATSLGAAYLWDMYIALGGRTEPGKFVKHKGFDHIWGKAYTIDEKELETFIRGGDKFLFVSDVDAVIDLSQTSCKVHTIGLLPSGFPFNVYLESELDDIPAYLKELNDAGVPEGYVNALECLLQTFPTNANK